MTMSPSTDQQTALENSSQEYRGVVADQRSSFGSATREGNGPVLVVTVDTEEEGLWSGEFKAHDNSVENIRGLDRFQQFCVDFGIHPTYLVDTPVVEDDDSAELLRSFHERGQCEIGAHLHPWCAPPFNETVNAYNSYMCNLPARLQLAKLEGLTESIENRFGRRPTSFRAGRYGLDAVGMRHLAELGYLVDSSVLPFTPPEPDGAPDHRGAPFTPYHPSFVDLQTPGEMEELLELPISAGYSRHRFSSMARLRNLLSRPPMRWSKINGLLDALNLVRYVKFTPEFNDATRLNQLVDAYVANGAECIVCMLHSSSLLAGCSPYARREEDVDRIYAAMSGTFEYCLGGRGISVATMTEAAESVISCS